MQIHLDSDIFDIVKNNTKDIEVRLYDEKRQKLVIGDTITFLKRPDDKETINAKITNLVKYNSFKELVDNIPIERLYLKGTSKEEFINILRRFYTEEDERKYGVLAIYFHIIDE